MAIDSGDPGFLTSLAAALGHEPPFTDEEVAGLASLTLTHARSLELLEQCTGLKRLRIVASELRRLGETEHTKDLQTLEVHASSFKRLAGAGDCQQLKRYDVLFNNEQDAGYIYGMPSNSGVIIGNPFTEDTYGAFTEYAESPAFVFGLPTEQEWQRTRRVWDRWQACYGTVADDYSLLVRPGLPTLTKNTYDALRLPWSTIEQALDAELTLEQVFEQHAAHAEAPDLAKLVRQRQFGKADVAERWIADSWLPADEKAAFTRFVQRFPTIEFFRADVSVIDSIVPRITPEIPAHYRRMTTVLEGWISVSRTPGVRFDQFQGWSPRSSRASATTYLLQVMGHGGDLRAPMLAEGFMVIGQSVDSPLSMLAMRRDDPAIYEYAEEDLLDAISEKRDITTSIRSIFPSYGAMLDHIVAIYPDPNASESIAAASL